MLDTADELQIAYCSVISFPCGRKVSIFFHMFLAWSILSKRLVDPKTIRCRTNAFTNARILAKHGWDSQMLNKHNWSFLCHSEPLCQKEKNRGTWAFVAILQSLMRRQRAFDRSRSNRSWWRLGCASGRQRFHWRVGNLKRKKRQWIPQSSVKCLVCSTAGFKKRYPADFQLKSLMFPTWSKTKVS